jgi:tetratricopeptide (TPR) repeat protein
MVDQAMYTEAVNAIQNGEVNRARDLLARLLKLDPRSVDCWIWMSSVVETSKERIYCLQEALRIDPGNEAAQRGLILAGALPPDGKLESIGTIRRNWQNDLQSELNKKEPIPWSKVIRISLASLVTVALIVVGFIGSRSIKPAAYRPKPASTLKASATYLPSNIPAGQISTPTPAFTGPTPLWMTLKATYTPTKLYVTTLHPRTEAYRGAMEKYQASDWQGAITYFEQVLQLEPNAVDMVYYIGEAYRQMGDNTNALAQYDQAIQLNPDFAPAYYRKAMLTLQINPKADIRPLIEQAVAKDTNYAEAYLQLAALDLVDEQYQAVLDDAAQAKKTRPDPIPLVFLYRAQAYLALNRPSEALTSAQKANQLDVTILFGYRVLGQALQANNRLVDSLQPLQTYTAFVTDDALALTMLGKAYAAAQDVKDAETAFTQALGLNGGLFEAYLGRGLIYLDAQDNQEALNDLGAAFRLNTKSFSACLGLGRAYLQNAKFTSAVDQFKIAEGLAAADEDFAAIYYWRASTYDAAGQRLLAAADWKKLLALPAAAVPQEWAIQAQQHLSATATATATLTPTRVRTRTPTATVTPTRRPTSTPSITATR